MKQLLHSYLENDHLVVVKQRIWTPVRISRGPRHPVQHSGKSPTYGRSSPAIACGWSTIAGIEKHCLALACGSISVKVPKSARP